MFNFTIAIINIGIKLKTANMDSILESRRKGLSKLVRSNYKSINDFCKQHSLDYSAVHRYLSGALKIGNNVVKKFEEIFDLPAGALDENSSVFDYVKIPTYSSTGSFTSVENLLAREPIAFPKIETLVFDSFNIPKENAIGIQYDNNSMSPTIQSGWCVLVDMSQTKIYEGVIYAVIFENKIQFRKLLFGVGINNVLLKPLDKDFKEIVANSSDCHIIGKAVYILGGSI